MADAADAADAAVGVERWFVRRGLPHLIADYSATDDIFTRAAPFLATVLFLELFTTFGDDWQGWAQAFAFFGGIAVLVGGFGLVNLFRRRRFLQLPDTIGPIELSLFVLLPALLPFLFHSDSTVSLLVIIVTNLVVLGLVYVVASYALVAMILWAARQLRHQVGRLSDLVVKSLPLLLLFSAFLFVNAEIWQVANDFSGPFFVITCGLLVTIGTAFVLFSLRNAADQIGEFASWDDVCCHTKGSPVSHVRSVELEGSPAPPELSHAARRNVRLVLAMSLGIQIFLVAMVIGLFFVIFGLLTVREVTIVQWIADESLSDGDVLGRMSLFGSDVVLTRQLLFVSGFIASFSGLQFTVSVLTDESYRQEFAEELLGEVREVLAVRSIYVATLISRS